MHFVSKKDAPRD